MSLRAFGRAAKFETGKGHAMVRIFSSISIRLKVTLAFELDATQAARFKQILECIGSQMAPEGNFPHPISLWAE
ncbi:MAG: hypothetical protein WB902_16365 [Acetobacteraceae bacterium]|jgi:hypothetical protein